MSRMSTRRLAMMAMFVVLEVITTQFLALNTTFLRISFTFLPMIAAGYYFGIRFSVTVAVIADIVGMMLFPKGAYFFGFTLSAAFSGLMYGLLKYRKKPEITVLLITVVHDIALVLINSVWLYMMYGPTMADAMPLRFQVALIRLPIAMIISYFFVNVLQKVPVRFDNDR